ncbi:MAG: RedB protein [Phycisphaerae bacterium]
MNMLSDQVDKTGSTARTALSAEQFAPAQRRARRSGSTKLQIVLVVWFMAIAAAMAGLTRYAYTPGAAGEMPLSWPQNSTIARDPLRPVLVCFLHPRCPCSRATLAELARFTAIMGRDVDVKIVMVRPETCAAGWEQGTLLKKAHEIVGAEILIDEAGREATRFGVRTSGHVGLYDKQAVLQFSGGITPSRGHEGANAGIDAMAQRLVGGERAVCSTPVFGCPLFAQPEVETTDQATCCQR